MWLITQAGDSNEQLLKQGNEHILHPEALQNHYTRIQELSEKWEFHFGLNREGTIELFLQQRCPIAVECET